MDEHSDNAPVPAATVVLLRAGRDRDGVETLLLHKGGGHAFGGMWVFPGGRVDPGDGGPDASEHDRARAAAVRETAEETGIEIAASDLVAFAHWTPPPESPRRFSTWFFVAESPPHAEDVLVDGGEIVDHVWLPPGEALDRHGRGEVQLAPPTWITLHGLTLRTNPTEAIAAARASDVAYFATRLAEHEGGRVALWVGDAGYDTGDVSHPGARHRLLMVERGPWSYERTAG